MRRTIFLFCFLSLPGRFGSAKVKFLCHRKERNVLFFNNLHTNLIAFCILISAFFASIFSYSQTVHFTIYPRTGCVPLPVNFKDSSYGGGGVVSREWYLGYYIPGLQHNQEVGTNYLSAGTYKIRLTVTFANGIILTKEDSVIVYPIPEVNFRISDTLGCSPLTVQFTDLSTTATGSITQWFWDLGRSPTNLQNPTEHYTDIDTYKITLFVINNWGCKSSVKTDSVRVVNRPNLNFTFDPLNTCKDTLTVLFKNTSVDAPSYFWDFGDGTTSNEENPVHFYSRPGSYNTKLRSVITQTCRDSVEKIVNTGAPIASVISFPDTVCERTPTVFRGNATPTSSATRWIFRDRNVIVPGNQVTYSFNQPGLYDVLFIVRNSWGCEDTVTKTILVKPGPKPLFTVDTAKSCKIPFVVHATNLTLEKTLKFSWDFGDGTTFIGVDPPPHTYASYGNYSITLTASDASNGCTAELEKQDTIRIIQPRVSISPSPASDCKPPKPFTFTASPNFIVEPAIKYIWSFGDGTGDTTTTPSVSHTYTTPNTFPVTVAVESQNSCRATAQTIVTLRDTCAIIRLPDPTIVVTGTCDPCNKATFTDTVQNSTVISWTISDGTFISTNVTNPYIHLFPLGNGNYSVIVHRRNNITGSIDSTTTNVSIICINPAFTARNPVACINDSVYLTALGIDSSQVSIYSWNFGDGNVKNLNNGGQPPYINGTTFHLYKQLGTYQVTLSIKDRKGCSKISSSIPIIIQGPKPEFEQSTRTTCDTAFIMFFKDSTTLNGNIPIAKWKWNFGDGTHYETTKDSLIPKRYSGFTAPVTEFSVTLTVTDSVGCSNSITKHRYVKLYRPKAEFFSRDTIQCNRYSVCLANLSNAVSPTFAWNLGEGSIKTGRDICHVYPGDGQYDVKLVVKDENSCVDSIIKTKYIKFIHPIANMSIRDTGQCSPLQIRFFDSSQYAFSYLWNFGSHSSSREKNPKKTYYKPGIDTVTLIVTGPNGCKDTTLQVIKLKGATGQLKQGSFTGCKPYNAIMEVTDRVNIESFIWDYGDGTQVIPRKEDSIVAHRYDVAGKYLPNVIFVSAEGCSYSGKLKDTLIVDSVRALFGATPVTSCDSARTTVANLSSVPAFSSVTKYTWDWGNGQTSNGANPIPPVYNQPGNYDFQLSITSKYGCTDTFRLPAVVKIFSQPVISISSKDSACQKSILSFSSNINSPDSVTTIKWLVQGNSIGTGTGIVIPFDYPGIVPVSLNVVTKYGCNAMVTKPITILPLPTPNAAPDTTVCANSSFPLRAFDGVNYTWEPAANLKDPNTATPIARPPTGVTKYTVTVINSVGCVAKDTIRVNVDDSLIVNTVSPVEVCKGEKIKLRATVNANKILWSPATGLSRTDIPEPIASPSDTTLYTLIGFSSNTCPNDTGFVLVKVKPLPTVRAKASPPVTTPGSEVSLIAEGSADVINYNWHPGSKLNNATSKTAIWKYPDTTTIFTITGRNQAGCLDTSTIEIQVVCAESSFVLPNAFTPGKTTNNRFCPLGIYKSDPFIRHFSVYNRWGQRIYLVENSSAKNIRGWDGTVNGNLQDAGGYVWIVQAECASGVVTKKGTVILVR